MIDIAAIEARLAIAPLECPECGSNDVAVVSGDPRKVCADCDDIVGMELSPENADLAALVARVRELEEQCDAHQNDRRAWNRQLDGFIAAVMRLEGERDEAIARETLSAQSICGMSDHATVREAKVRELEAERDEALADATVIAKRLSERLGAERGIRFRMVDRLTTERDALRAIIEGRTTSPTDAEVDAHFEAGGHWMVLPQGLMAPVVAGYPPYVRAWVGRLAANRSRARWWALDASGRPCPWPVTT